ncbi:MAG: 4Fe-4S dicluster domain-containing protein [Deltaproteobacteria bacterium]|nr:4Fe-4S dicluster domain-containing protein [Deltaproteobacteria bacterium]
MVADNAYDMEESSIYLATREILWNIPAVPDVIIMYFLAGVSTLVFFWGIWRRLELWASGRADRSRLKFVFRRLKNVFVDVVLQRRVNRDSAARIFHLPMYLGFIALFVTTVIVFFHHDFNFDIYRGPFYLIVTVFSDVLGLGLLFGVLVAFRRRMIEKPDRIASGTADYFVLLFLALLCVQGFSLEALRIHATKDAWALFSPVGYLVSLILWPLSESTIRLIHYLVWWSHTVCALSFVALIPYSKLSHVIFSSLNLAFQNLERQKGELASPGDIETLIEKSLEGDDEFQVGIKDISNFSWKQLLDLDACTACGRCQEVCPAHISGKPLSPKNLILDCRNHLLSLRSLGQVGAKRDISGTSFGIRQKLNAVDSFLIKSLSLDSGRFNQHASVSQAISKDVMHEDVFWSCTTCRACMEACPVGIEHVDLIVDVRRSMALMEAKLPSEAQASFRAIETRGNPFGPSHIRTEWTNGLDVPILEAGSEVDLLYWVGCVSAFDKRKQKIAQAMAKILNASGLKWGILGTAECCTGDSARRLGEENLFQSQAKKNIATIKAYKFKMLLATCPHCFNTLKNEYPKIDRSFLPRETIVLHHSQLINELIRDQFISLSKPLASKITYHDPCYLGRYNDTFDEPRAILEHVSELPLREMPRSREGALCCGAGGGHYWFDIKIGKRINVLRADEARATDVDVVATGCPFCMQMLEDGVKLTGTGSEERDKSSNLLVKDIAELVAELIEE